MSWNLKLQARKLNWAGALSGKLTHWGSFYKIFQWEAVLYVENVIMHVYRQHKWRDAGGRGLAIPSGDLGGDSPFFLAIWHVYIVIRSGDLALTWRRRRLVCIRDMLKIRFFFKKEIRLKKFILFNCYKKRNIKNMPFLRRKYAKKRYLI